MTKILCWSTCLVGSIWPFFLKKNKFFKYNITVIYNNSKNSHSYNISNISKNFYRKNFFVYTATVRFLKISPKIANPTESSSKPMREFHVHL